MPTIRLREASEPIAIRRVEFIFVLFGRANYLWEYSCEIGACIRRRAKDERLLLVDKAAPRSGCACSKELIAMRRHDSN